MNVEIGKPPRMITERMRRYAKRRTRSKKPLLIGCVALAVLLFGTVGTTTRLANGEGFWDIYLFGFFVFGGGMLLLIVAIGFAAQGRIRRDKILDVLRDGEPKQATVHSHEPRRRQTVIRLSIDDELAELHTADHELLRAFRSGSTVTVLTHRRYPGIIVPISLVGGSMRSQDQPIRRVRA